MDQCRFCLEDAPLSHLIEPCRCRGSIRFVHPGCLDQELLVRARAGDLSRICRVCKGRYVLEDDTRRLAGATVFFGGIWMYSTFLLYDHPAFLAILLILVLVNYMLDISHAFRVMNRVDWRIMIHLLQLGSAGLIYPFPRGTDGIVFLSYAIPILNHTYWIKQTHSSIHCIVGHLLFAEVLLLLLAMHSQGTVPLEAGLLLSITSVLPMATMYASTE